jgi:hypothetical protein
MKKGFNLSKKVHSHYIYLKDVREFIRLLKEGIINEDIEAKKHNNEISKQSQICFRMILSYIDKLVGEKLR